MNTRPPQLNLSNWRLPPYSRWSFRHVREVVPTANIAADCDATTGFARSNRQLGQVEFVGAKGANWQLADLLEASATDALLVAHRGELVHEWYVDEHTAEEQHIVFSVSKSITALLAGIMVGKGLLDPAARVVKYIPELKDSAYADCTVQHVLDMTVSVDFDEDYLAQSGKFLEYRMATGWSPAAADQIDYGLDEFLMSLQRGDKPHGEQFDYKSPNSDLLGRLIERIAGQPITELFSKYLWQPMGAEADAYITLDRKGAPRTAGGFCLLPRDLLRIGELVRNKGMVGDREVVPASWISDCSNGGDHNVWQLGTSVEKFPNGSYRNKWYQSGNDNRAVLAIGIHSQWIYVDPVAEVTVVKLSSQGDPLSEELGPVCVRAFEAIAASL